MANDKNFKVKNALEIGGSVKSSLGTVTSSNIDLSTGNYFKDTTNTTTYTISNPSPVQSFNLELTGGTADVANNFNTTIYAGSNSAKTITNNIDLAGDGGLVWTKWRSSALGSAPPIFTDTERGVNKNLKSNTSDGEESTNSIDSFTSTGYTIDAGDGPQGGTNYNGANYVSWTFKKASKFFDVVKITGTGGSRVIDHNLGVAPGMIIGTRYDANGEHWHVYHRSLDDGNQPATHALRLNSTAAEGDESSYWNDTEPTSTQFTVGNNQNHNGGSHIFYLFAHDTASSSQIYCDGYTKTGSSQDINIGWSPQWLMLKRRDSTGSWYVMDTTRGFTTDSNPVTLKAESSDAEGGLGNVTRTSTGFNVTSNSGQKWVYVAIREAGDPAITWPATVKWPAGITPTAPGIGETDLYTFTTDDSGSSYYGYLSGDNLS
jgi:hypothetical protein